MVLYLLVSFSWFCFGVGVFALLFGVLLLVRLTPCWCSCGVFFGFVISFSSSRHLISTSRGSVSSLMEVPFNGTDSRLAASSPRSCEAVLAL